MKKKITTVFLTLAIAAGFAQDAILVEPVRTPVAQLDVKPAVPLTEKVSSPKRSFGYLRMGITDSQLPTADSVQVLPGIGFGYRLVSGSSAIDISASFNRRDVRSDEGREHTWVYNFPKVNYIHYVSSAKNNSFYAGGGLAMSGIKARDDREFHGLVPNVAIGYEMNRNDAWRSFVQLDVSQAAIAASQKGNLPGPFAEVSVGAGF